MNRYDDLKNACERANNYSILEIVRQEGIEVRKRQLGEEHPFTLIEQHNLAILYIKSGRYGEAERLLLKVKEARERVDGPLHRRTLSTIYALGSLYEEEGRYAEAEALARHAAEQLERAQGPNFYLTFAAYSSLVTLYQSQKRYAEAAQAIEHISGKIEQSSPPLSDITISGTDDPRFLILQFQLADAYAKMKRFSDAEDLYRSILGKAATYNGELDDFVGLVGTGLADMYVDQGRYDAAEPLYLKALAAAFGKSEEARVETLRMLLGTAHLVEARDGDPAKAAFFLGRAVNVLQSIRSNISELPSTTQQAFLDKWLHAYTDLQEALVLQGRIAEAEEVGRMIKDTEYQLFVRGEESAPSGRTLS